MTVQEGSGGMNEVVLDMVQWTKHDAVLDTMKKAQVLIQFLREMELYKHVKEFKVLKGDDEFFYIWYK